jgi:ABC-2 type transport system ATP-binding protein
MRIALSLFPALVLLALGGCGAGSDSVAAKSGPAESRDGTVYNVMIDSPLGGGEQIAITVFEPRQIVAGKTVPLILEGHGYSGSRQEAEDEGGVGAFSIALLLDDGYGVISIDQRGHGDSGGTIRAMDPDYEGTNLVAILDWAEKNLDWLAYGPDLDGPSPNPVVGAVGSSYGGGYQLLLHAIDPRKRLDALVPEITWHDLTYSLAPGGVIKSGWVNVLSAAGETAGGGGNVDPFISETQRDNAVTNRISDAARDFFRYHGLGYFCDGIPVATNGGQGTTPKHAPVHPTAVNALFMQGFRDTLFTFNEAFLNYQCLKSAGGDVRLITYQSGHNTLQAVPDPGQAFQPLGSTVASTCGKLDATDAAIAFFAEHLKGEKGAAAKVPGLCLSLAGTDAVLVSDTAVKTATQYEVPETMVITGPPGAPMIADLGIAAGAGGDVFGGIPHIQLTVENAFDPADTESDAILFVGIGHRRASGIGMGVWDLMDNQLQPLRGLGLHDVDMNGVAERLAPGDEIALLIYGGHDQYYANGSLHPMSSGPMVVTVRGTMTVPLLGPVPPAE